MMAIQYQIESFIGIKDETAPLFKRHYDEGCQDKDVIKLDMNYEAYAQIEGFGRLHTVTVRCNGALIGYHVSIVMPHIHHRKSVSAFVDIYYLLPEHRKGWTGLGMFRFAEKSLKKIGVQCIYTACKLDHDIDPLLKRLRYRAIERSYSKII